MNASQSSSLESRAIHGVFWSAIGRLGPQAVQFIVSIVLARLLLPAQFGLIGMIAIFMSLGQVFLDSGFGAALIQKRDVTDVHYSSVFYMNILMSLVAAGALCLAAPLVAQFYQEPSLTPLTRVLSLNFVISAFGHIQGLLMAKRLDFKTQTKASLIASGVSGGTGITMALLGFGVWSLVAQSVTGSLLNTIALWTLNTWRPLRVFRLGALRELFGFSSRLFASGVSDSIFRNIYEVFIGKFFSATDLGYYTRAAKLQQLPTETFTGVIGRVAFPLFSEIQNDPLKVKNGVRKALKGLALITFPLMIGLMACARPLVLTLLTDKWSRVIPYFQLLCIAGMFYPLSRINQNVLLAKGRSDLFFRMDILRKTLIVIVAAITWRWGIEAMICGQILTEAIAYYLNSYYSAAIIGYPITAQISDVLPYLGAAALVGGVLHMLTWLPFDQSAYMLGSQVTVGSLLYLVLCRALRLPVFMDVWSRFRDVILSARSA